MTVRFKATFLSMWALTWGTEFHRACVLDSRGGILRECRIDHTGQAITAFLRALNEIAAGDTRRVAMAIEVPRGPVVEAFLEGGFAVFSINPKQLDRFRDRYTVAGAKDDSRDAYVLANLCGPISTVSAASRPTTQTSFVCATALPHRGEPRR